MTDQMMTPEQALEIKALRAEVEMLKGENANMKTVNDRVRQGASGVLRAAERTTAHRVA